MSSASSSAAWFPAAIARSTRTTAPAVPDAPASGRHRAPEVAGVLRIATPDDLLRTGRHAEPEWSRDLHDPTRDEADPLSWLGFTPPRH